MPDKFIIKTEPVLIQNRPAVPVNCDNALERAAQSESVYPQVFNLFYKTECTGMGDFLTEAILGYL